MLLIGLAHATTATVGTYDELVAAADDPSVTEIVVTQSIQGVQVYFTGRAVEVRSEGGPWGVPSLNFDAGTDGSVVRDLVFGTEMNGEGATTSHLNVQSVEMQGYDLELVGESGLYSVFISGGSLTIEGVEVSGFDSFYPAIYITPGSGVDSVLRVVDAVVDDAGPGLVHATGAPGQQTTVVLENPTVTGTLRNGGTPNAVTVSGDDVDLTVLGGTFADNEGHVFVMTAEEGHSGVSARFDGVTFRANTGEESPTILASGLDVLIIENSRFCDNAANSGGRDVHAYGTPTTYRYNVSRRSLDGPAVAIEGGAATVEHNTFLDHDVAVALEGEGATLVNNLFEGNVEAVRATGSLSFDEQGYNAWWDNGEHGVDMGATELSLDAAPRYATDKSEDCSWLPELASDSVLVDAGSPDRLDEDGSRSDIGALPLGGGTAPDTGDAPGDSGVAADTGAPRNSRVWFSGGCSTLPLALPALPLLLISLLRREPRRAPRSSGACPSP